MADPVDDLTDHEYVRGPLLSPDAIGLYHNRNRWYAPTLGRFTTRDPNSTGAATVAGYAMLGETAWSVTRSFIPDDHYGDDLNLYLYLSGAPVNRLDPAGLFSLLGMNAATGWQMDMTSMQADVGVSFLGAIRGLADQVSERNLMLSEFADIAASPYDTGAIDTALDLYRTYQVVRLTALAGGALTLGAIFATKGAGKLLARGTKRSFKSFSTLKNHLGPAGPGRTWHHIVEQCKSGQFGAERIHTVDNVIAISTEANTSLNALYSSIRPDITGSSSLIVGNWLKTKSYEFNRSFGVADHSN